MSARVDPEFSVVLCTHNGARFLGAQLASILAQDVLPGEIVMGDDASRDGTVDLARRAVGESVPLRVFAHDPALGVVGNFSHGLRAARGGVIALSDQDDVWRPGRARRALETLAARPEALAVFTDARMVDAEGEGLGYTLFDALELPADERRLGAPLSAGATDADADADADTDADADADTDADPGSGPAAGTGSFDAFLRRNLATGATMTVRRALVEAALPVAEGWLHDEWLAAIAASREAVIALDETLVDYRQHGANVVGQAEPSLRRKIARVLEPRGERNRELARRTGALVARLEAAGAPSEVLERARGKLRIETVRAELPAFRPARLGPVLRELRRGDYARYTSRGNAEVLRDLLQPA